jgi:drug/metabolite transporter (DMT)-like permease
VLSTVFYGASFLAVQRGVEDLAPMAYLALRFAIGAVAIIPFAARDQRPARFWRDGLVAGVVLLAGYVFQTVGLQYTTTSNSAFVTGLFVVFTPMWAALLLRRPPAPITVVGVGVATLGLYVLTGAHLTLGRGDALTLGCAATFGLHVALMARYCQRHPYLPLNAAQLAVVAVGCAVAVPITGAGHLTTRALLSAAFTGVLVSGVAISLQMYGQQFVGPTRTALLLTFEPIFAGIAGYVAGERIGGHGVLGAAIILSAVVIAEVAPVWVRRRRAVRTPVP